ncbi:MULTISPECIES: YxeA family protein [Listeria]|uniref:YxeA family protein n=1 Tax=Listeria TaxID=1637 RepID=UPI000B5897D8|nr:MULTISPECIES: YxeA family protein [Listeria]
MKNKKALILLLSSLLMVTVLVFEYMLPDEKTAAPYFVKMKSEGKIVKKDQFKGYSYTEKVFDSKGHAKTLSFLSEKKLPKNEQYKIVVSGNKLVMNYKKINTLPKNIQYLAEK